MLYFATSFLAPLILNELTSTAVEQFMAGLPAGELAVSHWTRVEFSSLLAWAAAFRAEDAGRHGIRPHPTGARAQTAGSSSAQTAGSSSMESTRSG